MMMEHPATSPGVASFSSRLWNDVCEVEDTEIEVA